MAPEDAFLNLNGLRFHYRKWGNDGRPVLLLHGLASNCRIWDLTAPHLSKDALAVALDQRGHGQSAKPDNGYEFQTVVGDAVTFIDALGLSPKAEARPIVVGHSWGASVALEMAARHPERVAGLVLVDGGYGNMSARMTWDEAEARLAPPDLTRFTPAALVEQARKWLLTDSWNDGVEAALLANFDIREDGHIRPHLTRERHMRILRALWEQRPSELFSHVNCPVLLAPTRRDATGPEAAWISAKADGVERALALLPHARLHWFEDSIHDVPLQRPTLVAEVIIQFLESLGV